MCIENKKQAKNGVQKEINLQTLDREERKGAFNRFTVNSMKLT